MPTATGIYEQVDGSPVVRFERTFPHAPTQVWDAITDPDRLASWFPTTVEFEDLRAGAPITFRFTDHPIGPMSGSFREVSPPRRLSFTWGDDVLTFELAERDGGRRAGSPSAWSSTVPTRPPGTLRGGTTAWTCWTGWSPGRPRCGRGSRRAGALVTMSTSARDSLLLRRFPTDSRRPDGPLPWRYTP